MSTKAELIESIESHVATISRLESELQTSKEETRRFQRDFNRESKNASDYLQQLSQIMSVALSELTVRHGVGVQARNQFYGDRPVFVEDDNEQIRLLRHIHALANNDPPF